MINYKTIELSTGAKAVEAKYIDTGLGQYSNNPLIEALPEINKRSDVPKMIANYPRIDDKRKTESPELRIHNLQYIFDIFQPFSNHMDLEENISIAIRQGYIDRNPLSKNFSKDSKELHNSLQQKEFNINNKLLRRPGNGFTIMGISGTGKSTGINHIISLYPQIIIHSQYKGINFSSYQLVWIKLDCPSRGSIKDLCEYFFREIDRLLGTNYEKRYLQSKKYTAETLKYLMAKVANACNLGILIIDEIQNLKAASSGGYESMLNFFVTLRNEIGLPVVLVGTMRAYPVLQSQFSQARRGSGYGSILWFGAAKDDMWRIFMQILLKYQFTDDECSQDDEDISKTLYKESQGIIDIAIKIFVMCQVESIVKGKYKKITPALIKKVARERFTMVQPMLDALRSGNLEKIIKYDDIIPVNMIDYFQEKLDEIKRAEDIKAIEEQQKRFAKKEEEDTKSTAKCKILDLGYKSKKIDKYLDKIFIKTNKIDANELAKLVIKEIVLEDINDEADKTNEEIDTSFYKVDKNSNKSKNESLKENGFIKL
ncbi:MAG: ATP-binding protein [Terrisporobacter sp.]|uniref:ATP-binding protein n=1 Tax=Terrisporobacter sp. TaxID=1965305 RepID=UPI0025EC463F|nr:ATP-binding protein [uncultured Terrisporobacter sp.]